MTIPRTQYSPGGPSPQDYGLPAEGEIAAWAAEWFPEYQGGESPPSLQPVDLLRKSYGLPLPPSAGAPSGGAPPSPGIRYDYQTPAPATPPEVPGTVEPVAAWYGTEQSIAEDIFSASPATPPAVPGVGFSPRVIPLGAELPPAVPAAAATADVVPAARSADPSLSRFVGTKSLAEIRGDFPILAEKVNGHDLVWLDNAATTQKPQAVIDRLSYFYGHENSNVHRGVHELADRSTNAYEEARLKIARFIGAPGEDTIVFVRGTTEGINLTAQSYVKPLLGPGDEIILTLLEHHANIVPWQIIAEETGARIRVAPIDQSGQIILSEYERLFSGRTRFVSIAQVSNALGTITPAAEMIQIAHAHGVPILVDGAQSISHIPVNVSALDADFFVFSGHKIFGPTGIGALYGKSALLEAARPYQGGGNMIADVTFERTLYQKAPAKFEAGTGNIADAVGLGAALDYVSAIGIENIAAWEHELIQYGIQELTKIPGLHIVGRAAQKTSVLSFVLDGHSNEEVGKFLNRKGIAVRAGHHCAQPVHRFYGLEGTVRPSLAFYNSFGDIDQLAAALREITG
ncbi:SufS family cysteine desulfurase [Treponema sp. TIM-1]|uniref:SufS family cysteine desulfurase n=1 Tax=Treponema sp. TIM-1 TaxID=2898417 RepID=UPI003980CF76